MSVVSFCKGSLTPPSQFQMNKGSGQPERRVKRMTMLLPDMSNECEKHKDDAERNQKVYELHAHGLKCLACHLILLRWGFLKQSGRPYLHVDDDSHATKNQHPKCPGHIEVVILTGIEGVHRSEVSVG
eukprot:scaffold333627_cov52-Prasinocladus_malaysianus.AAC.1